MKETRFYICNHCKNIIGKIHDSGVQVVCCGEKMKQLVPGEIEASVEKHLPVVTVEDGKVNVTVGSTIHPMTEEHSITWVYLETNVGGQRKGLVPGTDPKVTFALADGEEPKAVYAYCNLHGLWKTNV